MTLLAPLHLGSSLWDRVGVWGSHSLLSVPVPLPAFTDAWPGRTLPAKMDQCRGLGGGALRIHT